LADELGVAVLPPPRSSQGSEQFVKLSIDGQGKLVCNAQEAPQGLMSVTLVTAPSLDVAKKISSHLVEGGLAACVNILPGGVTSVYRWEGVTNTDDEVLMIIKSSSSPPNLQALRAAVLASHPYKVPEIIHLPVSGGLQQYVDWVGENSRGRAK
jgi:periplasmic divalent cation tolerance protein